MSQDIQVRSQGSVPDVNRAGASWGSEGFDTKDILVPKLLLAQGLSEVVAAGSVVAGSVYRSTNNETLMKKDARLEFVPLSTWKSWRISEKVGGKFEFRFREMMTSENMDAKLEWEEAGTTRRRDREINYYVLLPTDIQREAAAMKKLADSGEMPDPDDALLPCVITFARTSYQAGKVLATAFAKAAHFNIPPASSVFSLGCELVKNDKGTFYVFDVKPKRDRASTPEELEAAKKWYDILARNKDKIKVDENADVREETAAVPDSQYEGTVRKDF